MNISTSTVIQNREATAQRFSELSEQLHREAWWIATEIGEDFQDSEKWHRTGREGQRCRAISTRLANTARRMRGLEDLV